MEHDRENARVGFEDGTMTARPTDEEIAEMAAVMEMIGNRANDGREHWNGSEVTLSVSLGLLRDARRLAPRLRLLALVTQEGGDSDSQNPRPTRQTGPDKSTPARSSDASERATFEAGVDRLIRNADAHPPAPLPEGMETTAEGRQSFRETRDPDAWDAAAVRDLDRALAEIARLTEENALIGRKLVIMQSEQNALAAEIARLDAERPAVPPDRERLWKRLLGGPYTRQQLEDLIAEAAAVLRTPAEPPPVPPDRERLADRVDEIHHEIVNAGGRAYGELHQAAAALRSPADGYREGAEAMREACARRVDEHCAETESANRRYAAQEIAAALRALPLPYPPAEEKTP